MASAVSESQSPGDKTDDLCSCLLEDHEAPDPRNEFDISCCTNCSCGQKYTSRTLEEGTFLCPVCKTPRRYKKKEEFLACHWFRVPLCACGQASLPYIKCKVCCFHFQTRVLEVQKPFALEMAMVNAMIRFLIGTKCKLDSFEVDCFRRAFESVVGTPISEEVIFQEQHAFCESIKASRERYVPVSIKKYLARFAPIFYSQDEKDLILKGMITASFMINGVHSMDQIETSMLAEAGRGLDTAFDHVKEILQSEIDRSKERSALVVKVSKFEHPIATEEAPEPTDTTHIEEQLATGGKDEVDV